ncbi:hypothetical protein CO174_05435 [Candidatus Uhrbacteria bacterium CG_4_9_14_3_um_filter_50_9]|uniref:Glutamyl-tRNA amidotransferase n=1 Tax=Candidatus Uhrbacteria bacterium CG_4_9_14_3_um_filter_50_9 TaxID=1975035 RepID=A0A2M7XAV5_9BACT|nr:MAG: hypothetical protein CO174_05435 [Candidatus Uhrbacteria bacterium CG_4_9_14_3_um_filter_50_9]
MTLAEQITQDMKEAMKAKEHATLSTLRLLRSAIKNKQIDVQHELSDEETLAVVKSQAKQLQDSLQSFVDAGRTEMAEGVQVELKVLEGYLPSQMSDEALRAVIEKTIRDVGATSKADMGKVMGASMNAVGGGADGNRVKAIVQELLPVLVLVSAGIFSTVPEVSAAIPIFADAQSQASTIEFGLRAFRVVILWFGIAGVVNMLKGGFEYMVASSRDDLHTAALQKMTHGFLGTIIVAALFSVATIYLNVI